MIGTTSNGSSIYSPAILIAVVALLILPAYIVAFQTSTVQWPGVSSFRAGRRRRPRCSIRQYDATLSFSSSSSKDGVQTYEGPVLQDPSNGIVAGVSLEQLGIDLAVAPSTIAPGTLGLYVILSEGVESATIPAMSLLSGYSREGLFQKKDEGDKSVGFSLAGADTAVFYERQLMRVLDALEMAAKTKGRDKSCGLAGHALVQDDNGQVDIFVEDSNPDFCRYFVPALLNGGEKDNGDDGDLSKQISVQNLGQFCNDLAWSYDEPPKSRDMYDSLCESKNVVQLVWRLEFDKESNCLVPTWPVSVIRPDITFENSNEFMELGTRYGWNYWQASVDIDSL